MVSVTILSLRLISAAVRFLLIIYIEKKYGTGILGEFSIFSSAIVVGSVFLGMELHYVLSRSVSRTTHAGQANFISAEFSIFTRLYLVLAVAAFGIYIFNNSYIFYSLILILIITEHVSLECLRSLQAAFMPVLSSVILSARSVGWFLILVLVDLYTETGQSIEKIILIWAVNSAAISVLAILYLRGLGLIKLKPVLNLRPRLIKILLVRAQPFYIAAIVFSISQYLDRFMLAFFYTNDQVGKYLFVASLASVLNLFVTYSVGVIWGPRMVKSFKNSTKLEFRSDMKGLRLLYLKWTLLGLVCALVAYHPVLKLLKIYGYNELYHVYIILLVGNLVQIVSDYFNLYLYAGSRDWIMLKIVMKAACLNLILMAILVPNLGILGAAIGFTFSQFIFCYFRFNAAHKEGLL